MYVHFQKPSQRLKTPIQILLYTSNQALMYFYNNNGEQKPVEISAYFIEFVDYFHQKRATSERILGVFFQFCPEISLII